MALVLGPRFVMPQAVNSFNLTWMFRHRHHNPHQSVKPFYFIVPLCTIL